MFLINPRSVAALEVVQDKAVPLFDYLGMFTGYSRVGEDDIVIFGAAYSRLILSERKIIVFSIVSQDLEMRHVFFSI